MDRADELRVSALSHAIAFLRGTTTSISTKDVTDTADSFHRFLIGAWPEATKEDVAGLEAELRAPVETTHTGENPS